MSFLGRSFFVFLFIILIFNFSYSDEFRDLVISGTERVSSKFFYNELRLDSINSINKKIDAIRHKLDGYDFIENYDVINKNGRIIVSINEKKLIKKINFEGNKKLKSDAIKDIISTKDNSFFDRGKLDNDIKTLMSAYDSIGLLSTDISYSINEVDDNVIEINLHIDENNKTLIEEIKFIGNKSFDSSDLRDKIFSREDGLLQFGTAKDFSTEKIEYDKYLLYVFYRNNGFLDFNVESEYKVSDNKKHAYITYKIHEGARYRLKDILIKSAVNNFDEDILISNIKIKSGDYIDLGFLERRIKYISDILNRSDFGFVSIIPDILKVDDTNANIVLYVENSKKVYVNKINIRGNYKTYEYIIRDIIGLSEGQLVNDDIIERAKQGLISLGFLKNININKTMIDEQDKIDLDISFEESNTGTVGVGFGYSTLDKFNVNFNFEKTNLFGRLMTFSTDLVISKYRDNFGAGFGKPYIFNTKMFGGFDIFYDKNNYSEYNDDLGYNEKTYGANLYTKYRISSTTSQKFYYSFVHKSNFDVSNNYIDILDKNDSNTSLIGTALYYDSRDDTNYPLNGNYGYIDVGVAGILGGNKEYMKAVADFSNFKQIYKKLVFRTQISGGYIRSFSGKDLYPDDGFYVGGTKLRGFSFGSAGVKISDRYNNNSEDSIGGTKYFVFNTELRFPVIKGDATKVFGMLFYNAGLATGVEENKNVNLSKILDSHKIRSSCGLAFVIKTPAGNIGLEFSKILSKEEYDDVEGFRINLGTDF